MIVFPQIDPVIVHLGPLAIRWYGLMYTLAFFLGWPLLQIRARRWMPHLSQDKLGDIAVWTLIGIILGGRIGYTLFYNGVYYLEHPLSIFKIWEGGMSFHGGLLGGLVACVVFSKRINEPCLALADLVFPIAPLGLFFGRIGNFINGELWGRVTDVPWAMVFPAVDNQPRHPSQLYEAGLEGIVLFAVLWWVGSKPQKRGVLLGVFLLGYGIIRFMVEFVREPDAQLGLLSLGLSMGQWLCLPMMLLGVGLLLYPRTSFSP
ncbi:MAG: prolipoprotein diacylglyceryl transferase [Magnetococcus sp. DMHC-6]